MAVIAGMAILTNMAAVLVWVWWILNVCMAVLTDMAALKCMAVLTGIVVFKCSCLYGYSKCMVVLTGMVNLKCMVVLIGMVILKCMAVLNNMVILNVWLFSLVYGCF